MTHCATTRQEVEARLAQFISEIAKVDRHLVVGGATIDEDLRMESVAFVELQVAIEEAYSIEIDPIRVVELNEFTAIVNYVYEIVTAAGRA